MLCFAGDSSIHLYADDTVLYAVGPSPDAVLASLQGSIQRVQQDFSSLNLLPNTTKTKVMWFGRKGLIPLPSRNINTLDRTVLEQVTEYKYLGIWLDSTLSFSHHISKSQSRVKSKLGFFIQNAFNFHCTLYFSVNWPSLHTRRNTHWFIFIYKTLLGLSPLYLC